MAFEYLRMPHIEGSAPVSCPCSQQSCHCSPVEKAIRAYARNEMPAMTARQRDECINQIEYMTGRYHPGLAVASDQQIARAVLDSWEQGREVIAPSIWHAMSTLGFSTQTATA